MLRKKDTGELFIYTDMLAARGDMEVVDTDNDKVLVEDSDKDKKKKSK